MTLARAAPIAEWLNFSVATAVDGPTYALKFDERHIGNPAIRAIHGGVVSAFLQLTAETELRARLGTTAKVRTVSISIDFLASTRAADMSARARIDRLGRRIAFLEATAWQDDAARPVARARICLRIDAAGAADENAGPMSAPKAPTG
jgi:uncharacterized protein (TIGR00369 family)